jgi:hypothetical protein
LKRSSKRSPEQSKFTKVSTRATWIRDAFGDSASHGVIVKLSSRMKDRFDIFGTLPDVIDDDWIDDEERFEAQLRDYTERRARANAFDLRYGDDVDPKGERWELCEKVLARNDVKKRLSRGWGERERAEG